MKNLKEIKNNLGYFFLNRKLKEKKRTKTFYNFKSAKSVGIIFNSTQQEYYKTTLGFINYLHHNNINVFALGYVVNKEMINYFPHKPNIDFFSLKNKNWLNIPQSPIINQFVQKPFDILINLCPEQNFSLQYIVALSNSKLKICPDFHKNNYSDMRIKLKKNSTTEFFIEQIKHYLNSIVVPN